MKPRDGSASRGLRVIEDADELPQIVDEPMVLQEVLRGPEYTVNVFADQAGTVRAAVPHRRLQVRAGEVEKGRTERRVDLDDLARRLATHLPSLHGVYCFQVIVDAARGPQIIEINARFGGGYPLADRAGGTFARWLLEECADLPSSAHNQWREGVTMLRYDAAVFGD
jgi:carbamoyl-phosphate synthase large subunit